MLFSFSNMAMFYFPTLSEAWKAAVNSWSTHGFSSAITDDVYIRLRRQFFLCIFIKCIHSCVTKLASLLICW